MGESNKRARIQNQDGQVLFFLYQTKYFAVGSKATVAMKKITFLSLLICKIVTRPPLSFVPRLHVRLNADNNVPQSLR